MNCRTSFVLNGQERIVIDLSPDVYVTPLTADCDLMNLLCRDSCQTGNERLAHTTQIGVLGAVFIIRAFYEPGKEGILRQLGCRKGEDVWSRLFLVSRCMTV